MKGLADYFPYKPTAEQQAACEALEAFIEDSSSTIFLLKGHAGTGKTLLLESLNRYLSGMRPVIFLTTTGRAGKVLSEKTKTKVETIHRHIYVVREHSFSFDNTGFKRLLFKLRNNISASNTVYAVDECSMLSNSQVKNNLLSFGSGRLMTDLFHYAGQRKIIFSGDPAQLPPVNTDFPAALNEQYIYEHFNKRAVVAEMTEVKRYKDHSFISDNTRALRNYIARNQFPYLSVKISGYSHVKMFIHPHDMAYHYSTQMHKHGMENQIMITFTNAAAFGLNEQIRRHYYKGVTSMKEGDLLMVYQNNYLYDLYNGDQVYIEKINGPVEHHYGLTFRNVIVRKKDDREDKLIRLKLQLDFMNRNKPNLSTEEENKLMKDAVIRARNAGVSSNPNDLLDFLMNDTYLNALRAKFGYAVTAHKSQGGEWNDVYVLIEKNMFYQKKSLQHRWMYTSLSRSKQNVYITSNRCLY